MRDSNSLPLYYVAQIENITNKREAERALKESEKKYRTLIEQAGDAIFLVDQGTKFIEVNESACNLLGYSREELLQMKIADTYNSQELMKNPLRYDLLHANKSALTERKLKRKDGTEVEVEINARMLDDGKFQSIIRDITERKKIQNQIIKEKELSESIINSLPGIFYMIDQHGNNLRWNKNFELVSGYTSDEIAHMNSSDFFEAQIFVAVKNAIRKVFTEGHAEIEAELKVKNNRKIPFFLNGRAITYEGQQCLIGVGMDISERKMAEAVREKITNDLMLRNKDLEQFTYIVSHNLRMPVANIMGLAKLLEKNQLENETKKEMMGGLATSIKKLDEVITDLNEILKMKKEITETKTLVHFSELVKSIISSIGILIEKENINIKTNFSQIDEMLTIRNYMYSIFYNLISNSVKYRRKSVTPMIEISSRLTKDSIELIFKDNGMGIDLEKKGTQIFGLYKRFHTHIEGKGMGLFMVKTQVEKLGGKISVYSEVDKGTEFKIEFKF